MAILMCLFFTILSITPSLEPWDRTLRTPIDLYRGARGSVHPRRTLPRSKGRTRYVDMTSGRCQLFDEMSQSAETRGSGKMCSRPSRCQPMVPDNAIPYGRPWENQEMQ